MIDFNFWSPTYFAFGRGKEACAGELVRRFGGRRALLHYGGGSAERSGLLGRVRASLAAAGVFYETLTMMAVGAFISALLVLVRYGEHWKYSLLALGVMAASGKYLRINCTARKNCAVSYLRFIRASTVSQPLCIDR